MTKQEALNMIASMRVAVERLDEIGALDGVPDETGHLNNLLTTLREADDLAWWTLDVFIADVVQQQITTEKEHNHGEG